MKWQATEMDTYLKEKEYVDTALITLTPISWEKDVKQTVAMGEFISIIALEVEKQFHGRVIQFPEFSYLKKEDRTSRIDRMKSWEEELKAGGIKHLIYLTSDSDWKIVEDELGGMLVWLPTLPLEHMDSEYKRDVVKDQMKQLIPIMTNKWRE
ncbi:YpiF family protein [Halalkalibacter krulwichiae]|uniref:DUF2487 domain-containing protein n=1 Tax=Halalkalibacter krulwichiae TaxID=199441 RepID=A0A1X9MA79_9BACI|nr:YpiF family protein [Halalkalibacter krulwichiae]ARK30325.1 hypothetical protein BkAM31D_11075 [Halalkalibacter krulwichiae]